MPSTVNNPTRSIEALPDTFNEVGPVRSAPKVIPDRAVSVVSAVRLWRASPTGAWLITNAPFVTANANGPNSSAKFNPVASTAIHDNPAVEVICTNCN